MGIYRIKYEGQCIVRADSIDDVALDDLFNGYYLANDTKIVDVRQATEFDAQLMIMDYADN